LDFRFWILDWDAVESHIVAEVHADGLPTHGFADTAKPITVLEANPKSKIDRGWALWMNKRSRSEQRILGSPSFA
jgi:hypothetical protein